ncbi:tRNA uracil 4-sulfurtransferase ThiI [Bombilactobacillus thymidiniphilus]|uniref:Probable tRNA sulfurtransferase n=1 Tax=Bombilactobacillus thymidiniphilus TaxID=2923363 RepID=A0ABY4PDS7_9LACO|nr:tRNA uracil 4-sulfurtransferase ThiI [Bombilactobacillus thymidiniphilus]UQS83828.1 tRNA 4-thiouridine(8) synthase ThiI [Bombilactobacillus thymidiniphilus]
MEYTEIMVRYGELSTKGKNRRNFIDRLHGNVEKVLYKYPDLRIHPKRDRMHIILNGTDATTIMNHLKVIFGIQNFSPSIRIDKDLTAIKELAFQLVLEQYQPGKTFKITTKRADHQFEYDTNQINLAVGDYVSDNIPDIQAEMRQPDIKIQVEIRQDGAYLSSKTFKGAGGLPVGTAGKAELMLSGGIDSPVAGYLAMKRGVDIEMVHFYSPPYTSEHALQKAKDLTVKLAKYAGNIQFIQVPFTEIQETIKQNVPEGYLMTIQRRFMLRLTDAIRQQRQALAIFNGEAVGQVASQTLESMVAINDVTTTPILRPVATMDKTDIIKIAEKIDTFDLSIKPFEDCCTIFAPPRPKTKPRVDKAQQFEAQLDVAGLMERALKEIEVTNITPFDSYLAPVDEQISSLL